MKTVLLLIFLFLFSNIKAQDTLLIFFKDKPNESIVNLSQRAIARRQKNKVTFDSRDKNVSKTYIDVLSQDGTVLNVSRWLNGVSFSTNLSEETLIEKYDFIRETKRSRSILPTKPKNEVLIEESKLFNYGIADSQVRQINANCMHDMGYTGTGVYVAIIDAGFRGMDTISYFDSAYIEGRILDTYDFLGGPNVYGYSGHGTSVSSCIFGKKAVSETYMGTAVDIDIALYVSEDVASETLVEEFNLVAALERCDSVGADIATISLGYFNFDDPLENHVYQDLDGVTTMAAIGVNAAVSKGIVVIVSAGNSGPGNIATPCDADSSLCIGGVNKDGVYVLFSSVGPSSDGQVKPDVVARARKTWVVTDAGDIVMANGTSFSAPLMAGATACLIQANPMRTVEEIIEAIRESGHQFSEPDEFMGYGIPDLCIAHDSLQAKNIEITDPEQEGIVVFPNPAKSTIGISGLAAFGDSCIIELMDATGKQVVTMKIINAANNLSLSVQEVSSGYYTLMISSNTHKRHIEKVLILD